MCARKDVCEGKWKHSYPPDAFEGVHMCVIGRVCGTDGSVGYLCVYVKRSRNPQIWRGEDADVKDVCAHLVGYGGVRVQCNDGLAGGETCGATEVS